MRWETRELSTISRIGDGAHASLKRANSGIPYLTAKNITKSGIDYTNMEYITEETYDKYFKEKSGALTQPQKGDILYSIIGSIGGVYVVRDEKVGISSSVAIFRANSDMVLPEYLAYFLKSAVFNAQVQAIKGGVAQGFMSLGKLGTVCISFPNDIKIQERIVKKLSVYDELIENNQKQIKLLEEAAQRLYKEWFVDLRFPGHETTPIVDGIPEGWEHLDIDKVYLIKYGKTLPTTEISDIGDYPVYGANGVIGYYSNYNCEEYVTLITSRGNGSGDVSRTHHTKAFITNNSFIVTAKEQYDFIKNEFTYWLMKNVDFKSVCTGSAQPQLTYNSISTLKILLPENKTIIMYCEAVSKCFEKIEVLLKQNCLLVEARDRLLPKLMSGELEV